MAHALGYIRDLIDPRDLRWTASRPGVLARKGGMRDAVPFVFDQGDLGSCTANGIGMAVVVDQIRQGEQIAVPSRLGIYYYERALEGTVQSDAGAMIRDGMKVVATTGYGLEADWPYVISKFAQTPPTQYTRDAAARKAVVYQRVPVTLAGIKTALSAGFPVVGGFTVHESFESLAVEKTGIVPMPKRGERVLGGHCTDFVGWDDDAAVFWLLNSWSKDWGDGGFFSIPQAFATKYFSDCWTVTKTTL